MGKLIVENQSKKISDSEALLYVQKVIKMGRISNNDKQYCYATSFGQNGEEIMVVTDLNKKSDRFIIYDQPS